MRQLEPSAREGVGELVGVLMEALGDGRVLRIRSHCDVRSAHGGRVLLRGVMGVGHRTGACAVLWRPLMRTGGALHKFPFVAKKCVEVAVVPFGWGWGPCAFKAAGDGVRALAGFVVVLPSEALFFVACAFGCGTNV